MPLTLKSIAGKQFLLIDGFKYRVTRVLRDGVSWRCCYKDCSSWVKTNCTKTIVLCGETVHKHKPSTHNSSMVSDAATTNATVLSQTQLDATTSRAADEGSSLSSNPSPIHTPLTASTPSNDSHDLELETHTLKDLQDTIANENVVLKNAVKELKTQLQGVLDHSIANDIRLLEFTDQVFVPRNLTSRLSSTVKDTANRLRDKSTQTPENKTKLEEEKELLEIKFNILNDECKKMISSIRILEEDARSKNGIIKDLEKELRRLKKDKQGDTPKEWDPLIDYHRQYPRDSFRCLSKRLQTDLMMWQLKFKEVEEQNKKLLKERENKNAAPVLLQSTFRIVPNSMAQIPTHNKFQVLQDDDFNCETVVHSKSSKDYSNRIASRKKTKPSSYNLTKNPNIFIPNPSTKSNPRTNKKSKRRNPGEQSLNAERNVPSSFPFKDVVVMGDSHSRHLAALMWEKTPHNTRITGVCKPGAGLLDIVTPSVKSEADCVVLIAGTNDVAAGRHDVIYRHLDGVVKKLRQTSRVLVCSLPPRHDLPPASPVHRVISRVNGFMADLCARYEGVGFFNINHIGRNNFTAHGLHLRLRGKKRLAGLVVDMLSRCPLPPAPSWRLHTEMDSSTPAKPIAQSQSSFMLPYETYAEAASKSFPTSAPSLDIGSQSELDMISDINGSFLRKSLQETKLN